MDLQFISHTEHLLFRRSATPRISFSTKSVLDFYDNVPFPYYFEVQMQSQIILTCINFYIIIIILLYHIIILLFIISIITIRRYYYG